MEKNKTAKVRKTKEQILHERKLNQSMFTLSKKNIEQLGIVAIQKEKNILQLSNDIFVKVYSLKGVELTDNRKSVLVASLCSFTNKRMRLSSFCYQSDKAPIIFLTVFFEGKCYADVAEEMDEFDLNITKLMDGKFKITFTECNMGDLFMFIYMNYNGFMKKISPGMVIRKGVNLKKNYFRTVMEKEDGYVINKDGRTGNTYMCIQYPEEIENPFKKIRELGLCYLSCIDFQIIDESHVEYYTKFLEESYNSPVGIEKKSLVNLTFIIDFFYRDVSEKKKYSKEILKIMDEYGLVMAPGVGVEEKIVGTISSFGILDFHCSRNVNINIISKLFG